MDSTADQCDRRYLSLTVFQGSLVPGAVPVVTSALMQFVQGSPVFVHIPLSLFGQSTTGPALLEGATAFSLVPGAVPVVRSALFAPEISVAFSVDTLLFTGSFPEPVTAITTPEMTAISAIAHTANTRNFRLFSVITSKLTSFSRNRLHLLLFMLISGNAADCYGGHIGIRLSSSSDRL